MKTSKLIKILLNNPKRLLRILGAKKVFNFLSTPTYLKLVYWTETGMKLNLNNPQTFNEKIQWLKINDRKPEYVKFVDKYEVRSYIREKIGEEYLIPLIAVYDSVKEVNWDKLPNKFVLKCTHGSGSNIICFDKNKLDINKAEKKLNKWIRNNWYWFGREWVYKNIKPRIICEKFLEGPNGNVPSDYKVMCFNGEPKLIQVIQERYSEATTMDFYDINWNKTKIKRKGYQNSPTIVPKPKTFEEMTEIAKVLSQNIPFSRIDFYEHDEKLYFGEITLYPGSGFRLFEDYKHDYMLGEYIKI